MAAAATRCSGGAATAAAAAASVLQPGSFCAGCAEPLRNDEEMEDASTGPGPASSAGDGSRGSADSCDGAGCCADGCQCASSGGSGGSCSCGAAGDAECWDEWVGVRPGDGATWGMVKAYLIQVGKT
jgi:hypothetical protein